jgi:hypothetical protein
MNIDIKHISVLRFFPIHVFNNIEVFMKVLLILKFKFLPPWKGNNDNTIDLLGTKSSLQIEYSYPLL